MSTLSRGDEIERDFYALKAQEWACELHEAKEKIEHALVPVRAEFILRRLNFKAAMTPSEMATYDHQSDQTQDTPRK